jgi:hypothetical protein
MGCPHAGTALRAHAHSLVETRVGLKGLVWRLVICVVVWSQIALAAYACNLPRLPAAGSAALGYERVTSAAPRIDRRLPNLCMAHCQFGRQIVNDRPAPDVPAAALHALYALPAAPVARDPRLLLPAAVRGPAAASDPPHAILHCCLRD